MGRSVDVVDRDSSLSSVNCGTEGDGLQLLERCCRTLRRQPRRRRQLLRVTPADFDGRRATAADNLLARRQCHKGVFNCLAAYFMFCMISL